MQNALFVVCLCCLFLSVLSQPCSFEGRDLSQLTRPNAKHPAAEDYKVQSAQYTYFMNICAKTNRADCPGMVCQYDRTGTHKIATAAFWTPSTPPNWSYLSPTNPGEGIKLTVSNGDVCNAFPHFGLPFAKLFPHKGPMGPGPASPEAAHRTITVKFPCTPGEEGSGPSLETDQGNSCAAPGYTFVYPTCHACSGGCGSTILGMNHSWAFIFFVVFGGSCYIVGGMYYNQKYNEIRGWDSIPHREFWTTELPSLVADGIAFSKVKLGLMADHLEAKYKESEAGGEKKPFLEDEYD